MLVRGSGMYMEEEDGDLGCLHFAHVMKFNNALCTTTLNHNMKLLWGGKEG